MRPCKALGSSAMACKAVEGEKRERRWGGSKGEKGLCLVETYAQNTAQKKQRVWVWGSLFWDTPDHRGQDRDSQPTETDRRTNRPTNGPTDGTDGVSGYTPASSLTESQEPAARRVPLGQATATRFSGVTETGTDWGSGRAEEAREQMREVGARERLEREAVDGLRGEAADRLQQMVVKPRGQRQDVQPRGHALADGLCKFKACLRVWVVREHDVDLWKLGEGLHCRLEPVGHVHLAQPQRLQHRFHWQPVLGIFVDVERL
eukprot:CAMPEP_0174350406 /NCGR_PEP_ID=MMETSP0811_2-20130205/7477_1 /TAXON_ID=73025 ORGANISM="Eutreptiella gymnastica-like, Strain CCMP1594" /NCGR_SAMPLE_ID=MMETSP0811_2 /ASSEMBLY_ACC=CAM_ASM_000667 /LENGTH=260 /DNA_ID=CAMNT_0015478681 /DNA_START=790 /DNA_END=1575 /DNA_ORIENTATION=-